jgi:hypothetical protein
MFAVLGIGMVTPTVMAHAITPTIKYVDDDGRFGSYTNGNNTANILLWKGACKLTGLSPSLCMKGLHELVPNIGNVTNSTKESCYWPGDFPSYPGEPCCPYDGAADLCQND